MESVLNRSLTGAAGSPINNTPEYHEYRADDANLTDDMEEAYYYYTGYVCRNITVLSFSDYFLYCTHEFEVINSLKLYGLPLFVVFGSVGNMLTVAALTRRHMLQTSMSFYLTALMVIHTVVLYLGCGLEWLSYILDRAHVAHFADWSCKIFSFSFNVVRYAAWWVLVSMTVDCYLRLWCPGRSQYMCTLFISQFATVAIFVMLVSIHVHVMWTYEIQHGMCMLDHRQDFETVVWPWISAVLSNYLPIVLVTAAVIMLIIGSICVSHQRQEQSSHTAQLTRVTLALALFFLSHIVPIVTMNFIDRSSPSWQRSPYLSDWDRHARYSFVQIVFSTMECLYSGTAFLLLFVFLPALRKECREFLRCGPCRPDRLHEELSSVDARRQLLINQESAITPIVTRV